MPRKTHNHPLELPALELDCMRMLWALGEGTVHEIRARLLPERPLAYTTIMTVMGSLRAKNIVGRQKLGRAFVYRALVSEVAVREHALDRLTRNFFVNSRARLRSYLADDARSPLAAAAEPKPSPRSGIDPSLL
jgi:BlaI family transcriptional regulator, penicillinase repressor